MLENPSTHLLSLLARASRGGERWRMDVDKVKAFLEVVAAGSITAAAGRLGMTQPGLSRRIRALEEELGVDLFERGAHSISITPAGRVLEKEARKWLSLSAQIVQKVRATGLGELLRLGYAPSLAGHLLGPALERFNQIHPRVRVQLADLSTAEMKAGVLSGALDLIVTVSDEKDRGIVWQPLQTRPWRLAVPATHPFSKLRKVAVARLAEEKLLMFAREGYPDYWQRVGDYFASQRISPRVIGEFDGFSSLAMAIEAGIGVALVADAGRDRNFPALRLLKLDPEPSPICVSAGWSRDPGPAARVLVEEIRKGT
ncbi:MAG: LysR family transcriptional regulator [Akkermansiaceae bacterium]|jgi:DNA-binding transcriptional LysR family regulator|nr:LysR family transcriptional regulator [Akkermansiaceae bacterium]